MKDKLKILVADNSRQFLNAFKYLLIDGFSEKIDTLLTAVSWSETLKILYKTSVDLVFIDSEISNHQDIDMVKEFTGLNFVPLMYFEEQIKIKQMMEAGAKFYMVKDDITKNELQNIFDSYA